MRMKLTIIALLFVCMGLKGAHAESQSCGKDMNHMSHAAHMSPFTQSYMKAMCGMMEDMDKYPMNGDASHDFAASMIPHHKAAVEMAKTLLKDPKADPALRKMAESIITSQSAEIADLEAFLKAHP